MSRAVCVSIRNIGMIRKRINQPVAELLTHSLITSRLDTCNSLQRLQSCCQTYHVLQEIYSHHIYPQTTTPATNRIENHLQNLHVCIHVASRRVASRRVASRRVASRRVASRRVASRRVASRRVASRRVASRRVASRRVASRRVASRRVASRRLLTITS